MTDPTVTKLVEKFNAEHALPERIAARKAAEQEVLGTPYSIPIDFEDLRGRC